MTDLLAEIRARDALKGHGPAGVTMTQAEADRRTLLALLDRALIRTPITALGLDRRPLNLLRAAGIHVVAHLARLTEDELAAVRNMGVVSIRNIKARLLEEFGLTLGHAGDRDDDGACDDPSGAVAVIDFPANMPDDQIERFKSAWAARGGGPVEWKRGGAKL